MQEANTAAVQRGTKIKNGSATPATSHSQLRYFPHFITSHVLQSIRLSHAITKATSPPSARTSSSHWHKMLQDKHIDTLCARASPANLLQVSPCSFGTDLQQLGKCRRCTVCSQKQTPQHHSQRAGNPAGKKKVSVLYVSWRLAAKSSLNVYHLEIHLSASRAHVCATRGSANLINLVSKSKTLKHSEFLLPLDLITHQVAAVTGIKLSRNMIK